MWWKMVEKWWKIYFKKLVKVGAQNKQDNLKMFLVQLILWKVLS